MRASGQTLNRIDNEEETRPLGREILVSLVAACLWAGAGAAALGRAAALSLPVLAVAFGSLDQGLMARLERDGIAVRDCHGESGFALEFSRAFLAGRPAVIAAG